MKNKAIGNMGEDIAEEYLQKRFWRIISRNFKARGGEIDIIGYRFGVLVYFEVKTRTSHEFGRPADAVNGEKISRIRTAAREFIKTYGEFGKIPVFYPFGTENHKKIRKQRIDVIEIDLSGDSPKINHIKDFNGVQL